MAQSASHDIEFDPTITYEEFAKFARLAGQAIYHTPVEPARAGSLLSFDIGASAVAVPIDTNASYWQKSVSDDFSVSGHMVVPRLVVSKGFSVMSVSASYAKWSDMSVWGAGVDVPIINGGLVKPTLAVRGSYSQLRGVDEFDLKTNGVEVFLSKGFGPITPYVAVGRARTKAEGIVESPIITLLPVPPLVLKDSSSTNRYTAGVRISLLFPKIVVEATQAEERSYAAKVSFGF
ncbi:MAG TPA: hypothetical protein VJZ00_22555 [Thermoanaerobaculia bacterium]|nr:hypothetical protein [Thermoanaerobaculia bacterium]